jgi:hypothetical protein
MSRYAIDRSGSFIRVTVTKLIGAPDEFEFTPSDAKALAFAVAERKQGGLLKVFDRRGNEFRWNGNGAEAQAFSAELHAKASANIPLTASGQPFPP